MANNGRRGRFVRMAIKPGNDCPDRLASVESKVAAMADHQVQRGRRIMFGKDPVIPFPGPDLQFSLIWVD